MWCAKKKLFYLTQSNVDMCMRMLAWPNVEWYRVVVGRISRNANELLCVGWPNHRYGRSLHHFLSTRPLKISSKFIIYKWNYFMHICITTNGLLMRLKWNNEIVHVIQWEWIRIQHKLLSLLQCMRVCRVRVHWALCVVWVELTIGCTLPRTCSFRF